MFFVIQNGKLQTALKVAETERRQAEVAKSQAEVLKLEAQAAEAKANAAYAELAKAKEEAQQLAQQKIADAAKGLGPRPTGTYADETKSFGVAPPSAAVQTLNGPTPTVIPGGRVLTTAALWNAIANHTLGSAVFLVDVETAAHSETIPGASRLPAAGQGKMDEKTLQAIWTALSKLTGNNFEIPIVFFGADVKDWTPYNAGLRAVNMGYSKVFWYRGGIAAWKAADQPLKSD